MFCFCVFAASLRVGCCLFGIGVISVVIGCGYGLLVVFSVFLMYGGMFWVYSVVFLCWLVCFVWLLAVCCGCRAVVFGEARGWFIRVGFVCWVCSFGAWGGLAWFCWCGVSGYVLFWVLFSFGGFVGGCVGCVFCLVSLCGVLGLIVL